MGLKLGRWKQSSKITAYRARFERIHSMQVHPWRPETHGFGGLSLPGEQSFSLSWNARSGGGRRSQFWVGRGTVCSHAIHIQRTCNGMCVQETLCHDDMCAAAVHSLYVQKTTSRGC